MQLSRQDLINEINFYNKKISVSQSELENFLKYLDQEVFKRSFIFCSPDKATVSKDFERAFGTLSDHEKADYYLVCLKIVYALSNQTQDEQPEINHERIELQYRQGRKNWKKTMVIISYKQVMLEVQALKLKLKLENYIFRMSKTKDKPAFVLESTVANSQPLTLRLGHSSREELINLLIKMKGLAMSGLKKKISKMMHVYRDSYQSTNTWFQKKQCFSLEVSKDVAEQKKSLRMMIKARKSAEYEMTEKQKCQEKIIKEIIDQHLIEQMDNFDQYELIEEGVYIHKQRQRIRKIHTFPLNSITLQNLKSELISFQNFKLWKKSLCNISQIGEFPKENTRFFHQINVYKDGNEVDYVYLRSQMVKDGITYFVDKSITTAEYGSHETLSSRGKIDFCLWRVRENKEKRVEIVVEAEISHLPCVDVFQAMNEQIGELSNILLCKAFELKAKKNNMGRISFFSIDEEDHFSSFDISDREERFEGCSIDNLDYSRDSQQHESYFYSILDISNQEPMSSEEKQAKEELLNLHITPIKMRKPSREVYEYQTIPSLFSDHLYKEYLNEKFFNFNQCVPNDNGDLVFTNQQKIKAQGGVLVGVLKRLGANLLSGKSILNVSLPIEIFSPDTNLERLCKGMAYAPHFFEKKTNASPLERMKAAVCFSLGTLILYIDMAKPFNPILGETYQAFIDGCPIYGEQTSHHPPISTLLFVGREYFVSANLEAKVQIGMNSASGTNFGEYHIAFNPTDPTKNQIIFTSPAGELSGMIMGQRKLNLINKNRYYDPENKIFCEIKWGKGKSKHPLSKFNDFFEGKIVKLNKSFPNITKVKQSDQDQVLGVINGRWTQAVYFNDLQIFNINSLRPFQVTDEKEPLLSDSRLRQDRAYLSEGKLGDAQVEKEVLEEIQRRDRKLRCSKR